MSLGLNDQHLHEHIKMEEEMATHLENPSDRGVWKATVHGVAKSRTWDSATEHSCI